VSGDPFPPVRKTLMLVDLDDLWEPGQLALPRFAEILARHPEFIATFFTIPNKFGEVTPALRAQFPWARFAIHGWEHTQFECRTWTTEETVRLVKRALDLGYDPIFKAPNWIMDRDVELGLAECGVVLAHHETYVPSVSGLRAFPGPLAKRRRIAHVHTHITENPATDWLMTHPAFHAPAFDNAERFLTFDEAAITLP